MARRPTLRVVHEAALADLLGGGGSREGSGVLVRDELLLVVSDNSARLALLDARLDAGLHREVELVGGRGRQYEDLAADPVTGRLFVLIEALPDGPPYRACVEEYDATYRLVAAKPLDFPLEHDNKGIEGLSCVRRGGRLHLLGLCEGNRCRSGKEGERPGGGRVQVFVEGGGQWDRVATIKLPRSLHFADYAGISVSDGRIAVVSQKSSALWVGRLDPDSWSVDDGAVYDFPRDADDQTLYAAVEGVSWLGADRLVAVSDRGKGGGRPRTREHDESVAVVEIPAPW